MQKTLGATALLTLFAIAMTAIAQTVMIDASPETRVSRTLPSRGMTMESVEANFGQPDGRRAPVGDPPITRWEYAEFIVYFEYKRVIHSVAKRRLN